MIPLEWAFGIGAFLLGLVLAWAMWTNAHRNRRNDALTEEATREEYDDPDAYADHDRERLKHKVRPS